VVIGDVSTRTTSSVRTRSQGQALDFIVLGALHEWGAPPTAKEEASDCAAVIEFIGRAYGYWGLSLGGSAPHAMFVEAFRRAGC
jgi:hypothetical protein